MDALLQLLTSLGVSAPAGFNAYLALLLVGIGDRVNWITLGAPYDILSSVPALILLTALVTVEIVVDKVPALDSLNDLVGAFVRPATGAVLFAGTNDVITDTNLLLSLLLGGAAAGSLHALKAGTRPVWTATTGGLANPVVSVFEDLIAGATVVMAMLAPVLAILTLTVVLLVAIYFILRLRRGLRARVGASR